MKILEHTPNRLKLCHVPIMEWLSGGILTALSLAGLVYLIGVKPVSASLNCRYISNTQPSCQLRQFTWLGRMQVHNLYDLQGATVIRRSSGKNGYTYHVELLNGANSVPFLFDADGGHSQQETIASQINQFISIPNPLSLQLQQSGRTKAMGFGLVGLTCIGVGVILMCSPATTCTLYKRLDKIVLENQRWYGDRRVIERSLKQILDIEIEEKRVKYGRVYRAVLVIAPAERIPLSQNYMKEQDVRRVMSDIQTFLA